MYGIHAVKGSTHVVSVQGRENKEDDRDWYDIFVEFRSAGSFLLWVNIDEFTCSCASFLRNVAGKVFVGGWGLRQDERS